MDKIKMEMKPPQIEFPEMSKEKLEFVENWLHKTVIVDCESKHKLFRDNQYGSETCSLKFPGENYPMDPYRSYPQNSQELLKPIGKDREVFVCVFCQLQILDEGYYRTHVKKCKLKHAQLDPEESISRGKEKMYKCDQCSFTTKYKSDLPRHGTVHSSAKDFHCAICGNSYKRKDSLKKHLKKHESREQRLF